MRRLAILFLAVACPALASPTPPVLRVESPDVEQVLKNDPQPDGAPPLVAVTSEVAWSSSTHGAWSVSADGAWSWRLVVESPGSLQIALAVGAQGQPEGAELRFGVAGGPGRALETALFNATPRWLPLLPGDSFELSLDLPPGSSPDRSSLLISQVAHGFRGQLSGQNPAKSGACEIDVACAEADPWRDEVRSALRYTYPVPPFWIAICSGQAVRDEPGSFRPWVLTATHCGVTAENQRDLVVYWNDQASSCAGPRDGSHDQSQLGAIVRWEDGLSDTMLLELESSPPAEFGVHYSGWDATDSPVSGVVGIHHPAGDEKSISIASRQLLAGGDCTIDFELRSDTHWFVPGWDSGVTEGGSSGSAIWDQSTHRVVGVLTGGGSVCDNPAAWDCYGRFAVAWANGLSDWLDPNATGTLVVAGSDLVEPCPPLPDGDGDGVGDDCDVCPETADPGQEDLDADGAGDSCDGCVLHPDPDPGCDFVYGDVAPPGAPDGDVDVADVLRLLRTAVLLETLTGRDFEAANVAPGLLDAQEPPTVTPTGANPRVLDVSDVQLVLRAAVGLLNFSSPS